MSQHLGRAVQKNLGWAVKQELALSEHSFMTLHIRGAEGAEFGRVTLAILDSHELRLSNFACKAKLTQFG